jgi:hypothetical protein
MGEIVMAKKTETKVTVEKTSSGGRATVENKKSGVGVYVGAGGKPASRDLPKGEKRAEAGISVRFGRKKKK